MLKSSGWSLEERRDVDTEERMPTGLGRLWPRPANRREGVVDSRQSQGEGLLGGRGHSLASGVRASEACGLVTTEGRQLWAQKNTAEPSVGPGTQLELNKGVTEGKAQDVLS